MRFIGYSADMIAWHGDSKKLHVFDGAHWIKYFHVNDFIEVSAFKVQGVYSCRL